MLASFKCVLIHTLKIFLNGLTINEILIMIPKEIHDIG